MRRRSREFHLRGSVASYARNNTPHYRYQYGDPGGPVENQDHGVWDPEVGLIVADGIGGEEGGARLSRAAVEAVMLHAKALGLGEMPADEGVDVVRDTLLPKVDEHIADVKKHGELSRGAGTTLGALLVVRGALVTVGIGDSPVYGYTRNGGGKITEEQGYRNFLSNALLGHGRPRPTTENPNPDQVFPISLEDGMRFLIATDGLLGDRPEQRLPNDRIQGCLYGGRNPDIVASAIARLPMDLLVARAFVLVENDAMVPYTPKRDDLTAGVLFVEQKR